MKLALLKIGEQDITGPLVIQNIIDPTLSDVINQVMRFVYPAALLLVFVYFLWGGYDFLLSGGNPEKVKMGKGKITSAVVGFILLILSYVLVRIIGSIFGLGTGLF